MYDAAPTGRADAKHSHVKSLPLTQLLLLYRVLDVFTYFTC